MTENESAQAYPIEEREQLSFYFLGVTTSDSSIMDIFPRWMEALEMQEVQIIGVDHKIHDDPEAYRATVAQIKHDSLSLGGLVTTHKIDVLEAARNMFDRLHESAQITGEVSCISKRDGELIGHAKDPLTGGMSLDAILGENYFERTGAHVMNIGAGGSGKAIALHLIQKERPGDRPERFIMINRSEPRLREVERMVNELGTDIDFEYVLNEDPAVNDRIMDELPAGSVVINATGLGKDRPGSPITDEGLFPHDGVAWEINYRGALDFWHQAKAQEENRNLQVEDGWLYFLHGWTEHIKEVLHIEIDDSTFDRLAHIAEVVRPSLEFEGWPKQ